MELRPAIKSDNEHFFGLNKRRLSTTVCRHAKSNIWSGKWRIRCPRPMCVISANNHSSSIYRRQVASTRGLHSKCVSTHTKGLWKTTSDQLLFQVTQYIRLTFSPLNARQWANLVQTTISDIFSSDSVFSGKLGEAIVCVHLAISTSGLEIESRENSDISRNQQLEPAKNKS